MFRKLTNLFSSTCCAADCGPLTDTALADDAAAVLSSHLDAYTESSDPDEANVLENYSFCGSAASRDVPSADEEENPSNLSASIPGIEVCLTFFFPECWIYIDSQSIVVGTTFESLTQAREMCTAYAKCPLLQKSSKQLKFVRLLCFRSGQAVLKHSSVSAEFQREKSTSKCQCPFVIKLRSKEESKCNEVYELNNQHNHGLYSTDALAQMPQNRFIPDEVQAKMNELHELGVLKCSQIMTLIESQYFPDVKVTWTSRVYSLPGAGCLGVS
jgi:hypothetical protein